MVKNFLMFMTGSVAGLIAGYFTGAKRDIYLDFKDLEFIRKK